MQDNITPHSAGHLSIRANGSANSFSVLDDRGRWLLSLLHNGEQWSATQEANMRRIVAAWNACQGIPTADLEAMAPGAFPRGLTVRSNACEDRRRAEAAEMRAALAECVNALDALTEWGCTHTGPRDANSPHALLIAARRALDNHRGRVAVAA